MDDGLSQVLGSTNQKKLHRILCALAFRTCVAAQQNETPEQNEMPQQNEISQQNEIPQQTYHYHQGQPCQKTLPLSEMTAMKSFDEIPGPRGLARWPMIGTAFLFKPFSVDIQVYSRLYRMSGVISKSNLFDCNICLITKLLIGQDAPNCIERCDPLTYFCQTLCENVERFGENVMSRPDLLAINLHRKYGNIVRIQLPFGPTVFLKDPKDMLTVIENEGRAPERPNFDLIMTYLKSRNVETLATLQGEEWRRLRMKSQPIFLRPGSADPYLPAIAKVAGDLVTNLDQQLHKDGDFRDVIFLYVLECLYHFCFNRRLGALSARGASQNNVTVTKVSELVTTLSKPPIFPLYKLWRTGQYRVIESSMDHLLKISSVEVRRVVESLVKQETNTESNGRHFIETLITNTDLTEQEIVMTLSDFFFGGTDTTSKNLSLVFYHLAKYPTQQQLLYQELMSVLGDDQLNIDHINKMDFLKACVKESLRLTFPLAPGPSRYLQKDLVLSGYHVPKG
ncbi:hypothetical protein Btru_034476, partial [Bulinus truncatus]